VLDTFKNRIESIKSETDIKYIVVFKNDGKLSGATLEHPHSQIVGLTFIPDNIRLKNNKLREYYHSRGDCYYCSLINNSNIVFKSDSFICIMPDEARFSYETWIIPGKHEAYFENLSQIEKSDLAEVLQKTIKSTNILLDNPSFNLVMHNGTYKEESNNKYMHWHFQLIPRTTFLAGFEWATGIYVRHVDHKQASTQLKELILNN
jgi:UDPglucose--hexose-1-phosphate uridylyltransferase